MKHLFVILSISLVLIGMLPLEAQEYGIEWADTLDNGGNDYARGIAVDNNGNIYVTGISDNGSNDDYLTVKYDSLGNIVWVDTLNNGSDDDAYGIAVYNSGNVYVTGMSDIIGSDKDYLTVKYDALGNIVWADTLDNGNDDYGLGIAVDGSGNVYVTGCSIIGSSHDYLTVKYDASGNIVWVDTLDNGNADWAYGIAVDGSGNVYVTGKSYNGSDWDYLTVKYDALGNIAWADTLNNSNYDYAYGIAVDTSGNVYVTGRSGYSPNYLTIKYDALGNIVWADMVDNGSTDEAYGIAVDNSGNVYVTGFSDIGSHRDYLTVKYAPSGNIVWVDTLAGVHGRSAYGIAVDNNGSNVYVTGKSYNGSNYDYLTVKYAKYKDAGILSIVSPDTVGTDSSYTPQIWVKNNSYQDTLSFDISAYIDSTGGNIYADTQFVSNLSVGDSVLVSFSQWTAPASPMNLQLRFSILTADMNADDDTISKTLYVKDMSGILSRDINKRVMLNVSTLNKGSISFSYNIARSGDYTIYLYSIDGKAMRKIEGKGCGYNREKISGLPSGIYFLRLEQGSKVISKKVVLIR